MDRPSPLAQLPVTRSADARIAFVVTTAISILILWWIREVRDAGGASGVTPIFYVLLTRFDHDAALVLLALLIVALLVRAGPWTERVCEWAGTHPREIALATTILLGIASLWIYHDHPLCMDEYAPFLQSQAFASGHLAGQIPAALIDWLVPFQNSFIIVSRDSGAVASAYWPSFALLMTPFTLLGIPWACNPVLTGLSVLALHRLALRLFGDTRAAGLAVLFTVASPVVFADGMSYYSMTAHLLCNAVFVLLILDPTPRRLFGAGVVGSIALTLHNPLPHLLFALPWGLWLLTRERGIVRALALIAGYLPLCLTLGLGWYWFINDYLHRGPIDTAIHASELNSKLGGVFGLPNHGVITARLAGIAKVWLWAVPGLVVLAGMGFWRHRGDVRMKLLLASALLTLLGYLFVMVDQGHGWGYRYFHSAWFVIPLFAAAAFAPVKGGAPAEVARSDLLAWSLACVALSLLVSIPQRAIQIHGFIAGNLSQQPAYANDEPRIVFVDPTFSFYGYDLIQNHAFLKGNRIMMLSHGSAEDAALVAKVRPDFHLVYFDRWGSVYSAAKPSLAAQPSSP